MDHCPAKTPQNPNGPSSVSNRNSRHLSTSPANRANVTCTVGIQQRIYPGPPQGHGTPENGKRDPYKLPISLGIRKWEWYGNSIGPAYHKGVPCPWGSLKIPLNICNQPEELRFFFAFFVSRISHDANCTSHFICTSRISPGKQAMEGRRQAAAPQGLLLWFVYWP